MFYLKTYKSFMLHMTFQNSNIFYYNFIFCLLRQYTFFFYLKHLNRIVSVDLHRENATVTTVPFKGYLRTRVCLIFIQKPKNINQRYTHANLSSLRILFHSTCQRLYCHRKGHLCDSLIVTSISVFFLFFTLIFSTCFT